MFAGGIGGADLALNSVTIARLTSQSQDCYGGFGMVRLLFASREGVAHGSLKWTRGISLQL